MSESSELARRTTRRSFLKQAAAGAAASLVLPSWSFAAPPSGRLQHACIGVMGMGRSDRSEIDASGLVDIVALCDIDQRSLDEAAKAHPGARLYRDWREMFDAEGGRIDSVNVAIPDYMHAAVAMRQREIGTLRALGFGKGSILFSFLVESIFLALIGGAIGAAASLAMGMARFSMVNFASWSEIVFTFEPTTGIIVSSMIFATFMGVLGGFFPAVRAARVSPVDAMRA